MVDDIFETEDNTNLFEMKEEDQIESLQIVIDDELLFESIKEQIENPLNATDVNYLEIFENRVVFLRTKYETNQDILAILKNIYLEFYNRVLNEIMKIFPFSNTISLEEDRLRMLVSILYNFLVLNYRNNVSTFLFNYIYENKKILISDFDSKKKNVETVSMKKIFKNRDEAILMANIRNVIRNVSAMEHSTNDIISMIIVDDPMLITNYMIKNFVIDRESILFDNIFGKRFLKPINEKHENYSTVVIEVTQKLYHLFTKKSLNDI